MTCTTLKIAAYITRERDGRIELAAFEHQEADYFTSDAPKPWLQLPAGTGEPGETPLLATLREVAEESGLRQFSAVDYLGAYDNQPWGIRHVFHMRALRSTPEQWKHTVYGGGWDAGLVFHYRWLPIAAAAALIGMFNAWLPLVLEHLGLAASGGEPPAPEPAAAP